MNLGAIFSTKWLTKLKSLFGKTYYQVKILQTDQSNLPDGTAIITFTGLTIGEHYKIGGLTYHAVTVDAGNTVRFVCGGVIVGRTTMNPSNGGGSADSAFGINETFQAQGETLEFQVVSLSANETIRGNGTREETHYILEELPNHEVTDKFGV